MSETHDLFSVMGDVVDENTNGEGVDIVNIYVTLVEGLKASPDMTIEMWEDLRVAVNNGVAIFNNLIDEELARLKARKPFQITVAKGLKEKGYSNVEIATAMGIGESTIHSLLEED